MFLTAPFISDFCHRIPSCCYSTKFKKVCCVIRKRRFSGFNVFAPSVLERSHHRTSSSRDDLFCYRPKCCFPVMSTSESAHKTKGGVLSRLCFSPPSNTHPPLQGRTVLFVLKKKNRLEERKGNSLLFSFTSITGGSEPRILFLPFSR